MIYSKNNRIHFAVLLVVIWSCLCTLLNAWMPITGRRGVILLVGSFLFLLLYPRVIKTKCFWFWAIYTIIVLINHFCGDNLFLSSEKYQLEVCLLLFSLLISYDIFPKLPDGLPLLVFSFFIILIITTIGTIVADMTIPGVVRQAAVMSFYEDNSLLIRFYRIGMCNYSLPHALPVLIPPLVMGIKKKNQDPSKRIVAIVMLIALLVLVWLSGATIPIVLSFLVLVVSWAITNGKGGVRLLSAVLLVIITIPFLLFDELQISLINRIIEIVHPISNIDNALVDRLLDVRDSIVSGNAEGDVEGRTSLYRMSIDSFFRSPIWGTDNGFGGHSAILDRMASLGLIGILPLICFFSAQLKMANRYLTDDARVYYHIGFFAGVIMLFLKNMLNIEMVIILFLFLPTFTIWLSGQTYGEINQDV